MVDIISISIRRHILKEIEKRRGDIPRSKFVNRLLEKSLYKVKESEDEEI
jgi:metal-responsive CopG/Arc/MetJ family transcriptional regulator